MIECFLQGRSSVGVDINHAAVGTIYRIWIYDYVINDG